MASKGTKTRQSTLTSQGKVASPNKEASPRVENGSSTDFTAALKQMETNIMNFIHDEINKMTTVFNEKIEKIEKTVASVMDKQKNVEQKVNEVSLSSVRLSETIKTQASEIERLTNAVEHLERYSRRENVVLFNIKEDENEDVKTDVVRLFNQCVKTKAWSKDDLQRAHRLGKKTEGRSRPIIVRFLRSADQQSVRSAWKEFKEMDISVADDLTMAQRKELREIKNSGGHAAYKNGRLRHLDTTEPTTANGPLSQGWTTVRRNTRDNSPRQRGAPANTRSTQPGGQTSDQRK